MATGNWHTLITEICRHLALMVLTYISFLLDPALYFRHGHIDIYDQMGWQVLWESEPFHFIVVVHTCRREPMVIKL